MYFCSETKSIIKPIFMERASQIKKLSDKGKIWDMVVVGGGATGLGVAVDAATRGMSVACLEKTDFAKCTSSRSAATATKYGCAVPEGSKVVLHLVCSCAIKILKF